MLDHASVSALQLADLTVNRAAKESHCWTSQPWQPTLTVGHCTQLRDAARSRRAFARRLLTGGALVALLGDSDALWGTDAAASAQHPFLPNV
jgi:hypothetical protein